MKDWMRSHDFQAWCVIEKGNFEVDPAIRDDLSKWGQNEWKCMEANFKAKMYLNNAMCEQDADKVGNLETAKEMWAAIQQMHMGSSDLKEDHQMNARREFFNFRMEPGEPISTYQFRFEALCTKLAGLGISKEEISDKMKVQQLINGLGADWSHERTTFRENPENRNLLLHEIFGKLLS